MSQDQRERDRLLTETHTNVAHMVKWSEAHDLIDTKRFGDVNKEMDFLKKLAYGCIGIVAFIEFFTKIIK